MMVVPLILGRIVIIIKPCSLWSLIYYYCKVQEFQFCDNLLGDHVKSAAQLIVEIILDSFISLIY